MIVVHRSFELAFLEGAVTLTLVLIGGANITALFMRACDVVFEPISYAFNAIATEATHPMLVVTTMVTFFDLLGFCLGLA